MTGKNLYSSQLINYFIWTTTKSYNNKVDQAHVYLTHFFYLKVCVHSSAIIISTIHANMPHPQPHSLLFFIILAGFPAMITLSGNVPLTTLPAPTTTFFPNVVPFNIMELAPRKQPSPITTGRFFRRPSCSTGYNSL